MKTRNTRKIGTATALAGRKRAGTVIRRSRRCLLAVLLLLAPLVAGVPAATPAAATIFSVPGVDMGMTGYMGQAGNWLVWNTNSCSGGRTYNWFVGGVNNLIDNMPYYPYYYAENISSARNMSPDCNRLHLTSGPRYPAYVGWTGCVRPGAAQYAFGSPWNDNVMQIGLSYDPNCPA